jgi:hypothetical protein
MSANWIQGVNEEMERNDTKGAFTRQAKRAGMSVHDFAEKVMNNKDDYSSRTQKRASLALTFENMNDKKKMAHGGKTQGYNDRLNEDLGNRLGRESGYSQSLKDRRDESKASNKMLDRRAYSSVESMDKGDRMFKHGGKTQGYNDTEDESLGMRRGKESSKKQNYKARRDDSYGKFGKRDEERASKKRLEELRTELRREMISTGELVELQGLSKYIDKDDVELRQAAGLSEFARGGSVEGKIDKDRFVKLRRDKDKEIKKLKKEKGTLRQEQLKQKDKLIFYKETLKDTDKDCDTEVSEVKKDFNKEIKELKKDIGKKVSKSVAEERKEYKRELDSIYSKYDRLEDEREELSDDYDKLVKNSSSSSKSEKQEALLLGGIAGIFLGAFLGGR